MKELKDCLLPIQTANNYKKFNCRSGSRIFNGRGTRGLTSGLKIRENW